MDGQLFRITEISWLFLVEKALGTKKDWIFYRGSVIMFAGSDIMNFSPTVPIHAIGED